MCFIKILNAPLQTICRTYDFYLPDDWSELSLLIFQFIRINLLK